MLFAFVLAGMADHSSDIFYYITRGWSDFYVWSFMLEEHVVLSAVFHQFLVITVVAISWVGWSESIKKQNESESVSFFLLMVEVFLVVLYVAMASANDLVEMSHGEYKVTPSVRPEAFILLLVYLIYFVWDVMTDVVQQSLPSDIVSGRAFSNIVSGPLVFGFSSLISFILVIGVFFSSFYCEGTVAIVLLDISLIISAIFFRQSKVLEGSLLEVFPKEKRRKGGENNRDSPSHRQLWGLVLLLIGYMACVGVSVHV